MIIIKLTLCVFILSYCSLNVQENQPIIGLITGDTIHPSSVWINETVSPTMIKIKWNNQESSRNFNLWDVSFFSNEGKYFKVGKYEDKLAIFQRNQPQKRVELFKYETTYLSRMTYGGGKFEGYIPVQGNKWLISKVGEKEMLDFSYKNVKM